MKNLLLILILAAGGYWGYHQYIAGNTTAAEPIATTTDAGAAEDFKAEVKRSQQAAIKAHPDLGKLNSPFNLRFRAAYAQWHSHNDARLTQSKWPELLAADVAAQPAVISVTLANGKELFFETVEQKDAYLAALNRAQKVANAPTPKASQKTALSNTALDTGRVRTSR